MSGRISKKIIPLIAALFILIAFACVSVSKFVFTDKKDLVGVYTDFVLSHDGDGQTAVIKKDDNNDVTGYIVVTVSNFTEEKVSKRNVKFSLRAPTDAEVKTGYVVDAWGNTRNLSADSKNYEVSVVDENDADVTDDSELTLLKADARNSSSLLLKIKRKASADSEMPEDGSEQLSIILQTSLPYKDLQVFTVNTTTARLSVGVYSDVYNGYQRQTVNLKSSTEFVKDSDYKDGVSYLADVEFTLNGSVTFDFVKYTETYGVEPRYDEATGKYIITIRAGADVNLYFYVGGTSKVTLSATVYDGKTEAGSERVSGVGSGNVVFET